MQENTSAEPVANPKPPTDSVENTSKHTEPAVDAGGEPTEWEYEFSNYYQGAISFIGLWDTNDVSACERIIHRPVAPTEISYSESGNGFIVDGEFKFTFKKQPIHRSWKTHADIKAGVQYEHVLTEQTPRTKPKLMSVEELLAGI